MKKTAGIIFTLNLFLLLSCASTGLRKPVSLMIHSPEEWPEAYRLNFEKLRTLQSKARLTIQTPEMSMHLTVQLLYAAPDTLFLQAEGPLGMDVGKIFIGRNRFLIYNQYQNHFFSGSLEDEYYNTFLETNLTFRQIKYALLGFVPLPANLQLVDRKHGVFSALVNGEKWRFKVDLRRGVLQSREIFRNGEPVFKQEFENYRLIKGILIPGRVRIMLPQKHEGFSVSHKNIRINEPIDPRIYQIEIGPKVKQLIVKE